MRDREQLDSRVECVGGGVVLGVEWWRVRHFQSSEAAATSNQSTYGTVADSQGAAAHRTVELDRHSRTP